MRWSKVVHLGRYFGFVADVGSRVAAAASAVAAAGFATAIEAAAEIGTAVAAVDGLGLAIAYAVTAWLSAVSPGWLALDGLVSKMADGGRVMKEIPKRNNCDTKRVHTIKMCTS